MKNRKTGKKLKLKTRGGKVKKKVKTLYDGSEPIKDNRREAFCQEYVKEPISSTAAIKAGYSKKGAPTQGSRLLIIDEIDKRWKYLRSKKAEKFEIKQDWVLTKLQFLAVEGKTQNTQIRALELLGKYFALFTDKVKHEGLPKRIVIRNSAGVIQEEIK